MKKVGFLFIDARDFFFKRFKWNTHGLQNQKYVIDNEFCTLKRTLSEIQYERRKA